MPIKISDIEDVVRATMSGWRTPQTDKDRADILAEVFPTYKSMEGEPLLLPKKMTVWDGPVTYYNVPMTSVDVVVEEKPPDPHRPIPCSEPPGAYLEVEVWDTDVGEWLPGLIDIMGQWYVNGKRSDDVTYWRKPQVLDAAPS